MNRDEFAALMDEVDRKLQTQGVPVFARPNHAFGEIAKGYEGPILGVGVDLNAYPEYEGPNLFRKICDWYTTRYGRRNDADTRFAFVRDWRIQWILKKGLIAVAGYVVVGLLFGTFVALRSSMTSISSAETLILSTLVAAPLALALLWGHLKGLKAAGIEIELREVTPEINVQLSTTLQELAASVTPELIQQINAAIERATVLLQVNLRSEPYWWSTRLYLLAALAEDYTNIKRLVFVEQDAARFYVGMAPPHGVRRKLAALFPDYESKFLQAQQNLPHGLSSAQTIELLVNSWSGSFGGQEKQQTRLITPMDLRAWLDTTLETVSREWNGGPGTSRLYARILSCPVPYVPLVHNMRLEMVVNRSALALQIAESTLKQQLQ